MATIRVSKLDAACRQLRTAITLWFSGGDPVAVHALAFAAYEVLHALSKKRDPNRPALLFDCDHVKDEYRGEFNKLVKRHAHFFKHANRDGDSVIEFDPAINGWFILYAITARQLCGEPQSTEESDFSWWWYINNPKCLTEEGHKKLTDLIPIHTIEAVRKMDKREFFDAASAARRSGRPAPAPPSFQPVFN